jgi:phage recombination protein Bet
MVKGKELAETARESLPTITADDVRKFFCANATEKEVAMFLNIAKLNGLNPFKREVYIVKYGANAASILTGYEVYLKRAERSGKYAGFKVWVEGNVPEMKACIEVYRKDWEKPLYHEVEYAEYVQHRTDGKPTRFWAEKPKTMLKKVCISQAFRFAFPDELCGMPYTTDEINPVEAEIIENKTDVVVPQLKETEEPIALDDKESVDLYVKNDKDVETITEKQRKLLWVVAKGNEWTEEGLRNYLKTAYNIESTKDILASKFDGIITFLQQK